MNFQHIAFAALIAATPVASETLHQPYKGLEIRKISSLSETDIEALKSGAGWGLALPAELNGYPGPAHILELGAELGLSNQQTADIQAIFDAMQIDAIAKGSDLIEAERQLDQGFQSGDLTLGSLNDLIAQAETARASSRFVHLSRHLAAVELLTDEQIVEYAVLRGYSSDPCETVPEGHDSEMWKRHIRCDG